MHARVRECVSRVPAQRSAGVPGCVHVWSSREGIAEKTLGPSQDGQPCLPGAAGQEVTDRVLLGADRPVAGRPDAGRPGHWHSPAALCEGERAARGAGCSAGPGLGSSGHRPARRARAWGSLDAPQFPRCFGRDELLRGHVPGA